MSDKGKALNDRPFIGQGQAESYYILCPVKVTVYRGQIAGADWPDSNELKASLGPFNRYQTSNDAISTLKAMYDVVGLYAAKLLRKL